MGYQAQATFTCTIITILNLAVPKQFRCDTTAVRGAIIGVASYCSNQDPHTILLALHLTCGIPILAKHQANATLFVAPWTANDPIESYFDNWLEDCYIAAIIATPSYTMKQMVNRAIMGIQLTGLYNQALIE